MEAQATLEYLRMAPRKVRVLLNAIRDENVEIALSQLRFTNRRAAHHIVKLLESAVANASIKFGKADASELYVKAAYANEGPTLRRFRPRAMGRATRINKKTSHVTVVVAERESVLDLTELARFCRTAGLAPQKWPERLEQLEALPRNASGKVRKIDLERRFGGRQ